MIYRSPQPDITIPDITLTDFVLGDSAQRFADKPALIDGLTGRHVTYRELSDTVHAGAAGFVRLGVRPGDVVAVMSHNQPRFAAVVHAALAAGAAITPVNPIATAEEVARQLAASNASVLVASEESGECATAAAALSGVDRVVSLGTLGQTTFDDLLADGGRAPTLDIDPSTAPAAIPFSSGTSGKPKGVRLTHRNLVANLAQLRTGWRITAADTQLAVLPFFHIYGFTVILNSGLLAGATIVTLARFDTNSYLDTLERYGVTRTYCAPPMLLAIGAAAPSPPPVRLKYAICGAAPLDVEVLHHAEERLGAPIRQGYGMTETSPGTHQVADADFTTSPAGCVGTLLPNTEARLVDPESHDDVEPGVPGELLIRGPQVMDGYLDNAEATAETLTDGWLHTGDLVRVDDDGRFWVVDRLKELIKYKGYQIAPAELESILLTHPMVADVAVIGIPHHEGGEAPKAFVVAREPVDEAELMSFVAARVTPYKKVRQVQFVDAIPKSPTGKILRRVLKAGNHGHGARRPAEEPARGSAI